MADDDFDASDLSGAAEGWEQRVLDAADRYTQNDPYYDEVFNEVSEKIRAAGEASKADIAVITFWKRSAQGSWIGDLLALPDKQVRMTTREAFGVDGDSAKLNVMSNLPGFASKEAIPTALLCAHDPVNYAVMDRRALSALQHLGLGVGRERGMTIRYLERVRAIRDRLRDDRAGLTARDVDKALFVLVGSGTDSARTIPATFDRAALEAAGFQGFVPFSHLPSAGAPRLPGVYAVVREADDAPQFLGQSVGGHFKGQDPTVPVNVLTDKWVDRATVLYFGKAGDLANRLKQFAAFGAGKPVGHKGGRYLWQLTDHDRLLVAWLPLLDGTDPFDTEYALLDAFADEHGVLPYANINRSRAPR